MNYIFSLVHLWINHSSFDSEKLGMIIESVTRQTTSRPGLSLRYLCTNNPCVLHPENNVDNRQDRQYGWLRVTMQWTHRHYPNIEIHWFWDLLIFFLFQVRIPVPVSEDCPVELTAKDKIAFVIWLLQSQSLFISSYFTCHILDSCNINTNINIQWKNTN